ncbi:MAG: DUF3107 domain-containing protein [Micropruina sp.]|uniref:DUF3107 domain-containing protein n=1 Tax=Micropruina sp. TaxID=2737536 RepID=UPI0039E72696
MEIKVGIVHGPREIVLESEETAADVEAAFGKAVAEGAVLTLTDDRGRKVLIPAARIAYLELGQEAARRVGFGAL